MLATEEVLRENERYFEKSHRGSDKTLGLLKETIHRQIDQHHISPYKINTGNENKENRKPGDIVLMDH